MLFIEYMFYHTYSHDTLGFKSSQPGYLIFKEPLNDRIQNTMLLSSKTPKEKMIKAFRILNVLYKINDIAKNSPQKTYTGNSDLYRYFFLIGVWIYTCGVVFIWHPYSLNPLKNSENWYNDFICNAKEHQLTFKGDISSCVPYLKNRDSQGFLALVVIYLFVAVFQIRRGKKFINVDRVDEKNYIHQAKFYALMFIPLFREITVTLEYVVMRTQLMFEDILLLNDLKMQMIKAKIRYFSVNKNPVGIRVNRKSQLIQALSILSLTGMAVILPLYLFSDARAYTAYDIESGKFQILLEDKDHREITHLFSSSIIYSNEKNYTKLNSKIEKFYSQNLELNRYQKFRFRKVNFKPYSDEYLNLSPSVRNLISELIKNDKQLFIKIRLEFQVIFLLLC